MEKQKAVSAWVIAKYLLSLDPKRRYFTNRKLNSHFTDKLSMGNFRLNTHLQIAQMLYYAQYQKPLFTDDLTAYEHGGYIESITEDISSYPRISYKGRLTKETKDFLSKLFFCLKDNYTNQDLETFACEDLAWSKACEQPIKKFVYDQEVMEDYRILIKPLWKQMIRT